MSKERLKMMEGDVRVGGYEGCAEIAWWESLTEEEKALKKNKKLWKAEMPSVSEREKSSLIFNKIFSKSSLFKELEKHSSLLNEYSWDDLNILYGTRSSINKCYLEM